MTNESAQAVLDRVLQDLKSGETTRQLAGIRELERVNYSSEAVLLQLEQLALTASGPVQRFALGALAYKSSQFVASRLSMLSKPERTRILAEIEEWVDDGLLEPHRAEILKRRYDFDLHPSLPTRAAPVEGEPIAAVPANAAPAPAVPAAEPGSSPAPRPSLAQVLLSETSIRIYLYLGAFFVIASAAILAAVIAAVRLPILLIATAAFGGGAVFAKRRLPQPSFAFAVVFSFLLPIDAAVIADLVKLAARAGDFYWGAIFLALAAVWGLGTWFYESRLFSLAAYLALIAATLRFASGLRLEDGWFTFFVSLPTLLALAGVAWLKRWKDQKFSLPLFLTAQLVQGIALLISLGMMAITMFDSHANAGQWIAHTSTWLLSAAFFALSDLVIPFLLFPWLAIGSVFLIPWLGASIFRASNPVMIGAFALWAAVLGAGSEIVRGLPSSELKKYQYPLLLISVPLFLVAATWGLVENVTYGFMTLLVAATVYTGLHARQPRWAVWMLGLVAGLGAYLSFFDLPFMTKVEIFPGYLLTGASLLLMGPELFFKGPFTVERPWSWSPIMLGALVTAGNLLLISAEVLLPQTAYENFGRSALVLGLYTLLFIAYAWRFRQIWVGYLSAASAALTVYIAVVYINVDRWPPVLTALTVLAYLAGLGLRRWRPDARRWAQIPIDSSLLLGILISAGLVTFQTEAAGLYLALIALLFAAEALARPLPMLEVLAELLVSLALFRFLVDAKLPQAIEHALFGASLIWLGGDLLFRRLQEQRSHRLFTIGAGYLLVAVSTVLAFIMLQNLIPVAYFLAYAAFFLLSAWLQREPRLGYLTTAFLLLALIVFMERRAVTQWTFPLIGLALLYYILGFVFRQLRGSQGWQGVFLYSGLALGVFTSVSAPFQGGLAACIPVAIAATLFAAEAFVRRDVWWALPANGLYLLAYFILLSALNVDQPQFYSIGAAFLGMLMHFLLQRAGSKTGAFVMGTLSQLVLLGTTYLQMVSELNLGFFFVLFVQSLAVLAYGLVMRSRSLVIAPIFFAVLGVSTVLFYALRNLSLVVIIGFTGLVLLALGIVAVLMRERITTLAERFSDWNA